MDIHLENKYGYIPILDIAYTQFLISKKKKTLTGHFSKGVMFWYYHLTDQTIRKNQGEQMPW